MVILLKQNKNRCKVITILLFTNIAVIFLLHILSILLAKNNQLSFSIIADMINFIFYATLCILLAVRTKIFYKSKHLESDKCMSLHELNENYNGDDGNYHLNN